MGVKYTCKGSKATQELTAKVNGFPQWCIVMVDNESEQFIASSKLYIIILSKQYTKILSKQHRNRFWTLLNLLE